MADAEEQQRKIGRIIAKAWSDKSFKQQLLADPAPILKAEGVTLPPGVQVRVVENTGTLVHLVLPPRPVSAELSDDDLEKIAGGFRWCYSFNPVGGV